MKAAPRLEPRQRDGVPAAETGDRAQHAGAAHVTDNRTAAGAPQRAAAAMGTSSYIAVQRKRIGGMFGQTAQLQPGEEEVQMRSLPPTIQRKWAPGEKKGILVWDSIVDGNRWFYNTETDRQSYVNSKGEASEERTYLEWLKMGFLGLKESVLKADALSNAPGLDPRAETPDESFFRMRNDGRVLYQSTVAGGSGALNPVWKDDYAPYTVVELYGSNEGLMAHVRTGYQKSYIRRMQENAGLGRYDNKFNLETGMVTAIDNHRDPKAGEPLNNNEIFFHQLAMACEEAQVKMKITGLFRKNVVNSVLEPILRKLKGAAECRPDNENSDLFYVLLTTPNVKAALFIIKDRGLLLGISTISRIVVKGKDVIIYFA